MSTLSIIVLSVLAAIFSILTLAAISALAYTHLLVRRQISEFTSIVTSTGIKLDSQIDRIDRLISNVQGDKLSRAAQAILESIPKQLQTAVRMEKTVIAFTEALKIIGGEQEREISDEAIQRARASGLGPESYASAAPDEHYVSRSRSATEDAIARAEEAADNTATGQYSGDGHGIGIGNGIGNGLNTFGGESDI